MRLAFGLKNNGNLQIKKGRPAAQEGNQSDLSSPMPGYVSDQFSANILIASSGKIDDADLIRLILHHPHGQSKSMG